MPRPSPSSPGQSLTDDRAIVYRLQPFTADRVPAISVRIATVVGTYLAHIWLIFGPYGAMTDA
eukprot:6753022-Lingulodinium_polyedra.AAC.1